MKLTYELRQLIRHMRSERKQELIRQNRVSAMTESQRKYYAELQHRAEKQRIAERNKKRRQRQRKRETDSV